MATAAAMSGQGRAGAERPVRLVFGVALAGGLATVALLYAALFFWSARTDAISAEREIQLVQNGLGSQIREIEDALTSVTQWDDAVAHTNPPLDRDWVDTNIGAFLDQSLGVAAGAVLGADDAPLYAMQGGAEADPAALSHVLGAAAPLVRAVRAAETARGGFPADPDGATVISTPIRASAAALLDGAPYVLTVTLVQPDFGAALPGGPRGAIVVSAAPFDGPFERLAAHYMLSRASLHPGAQPAAMHQARAVLRAPDGTEVATLLWSPQRPGHRLLLASLPVVSLAILVLAAGALAALLELQRALRRLVAARDAAEVANRAKSHFLATMSHEIRTPLNGVLGMTQVLLLNEQDSDRRQNLDVIRASGETLLSILNDVLDMSKLEAGKIELEAAPFDLAAMASDACAGFQAIAQAKGLAFALHIEPSARGVWRGDALRLRQILCNLASNAVKFTQAGRVEIHIAAQARGDAEWLEMRVTDTGVGVTEAALPHLFQRFVQADASHTRRFGGTGLGLAIAQDIAGLMGGAIRVRSTPGEGSVFWLEAPLARVEAPASAAA